MTEGARRVLVLGGSSGIGRSLAVALGRHGDSVAIVARRSALVSQAAAAAGPASIALTADVTDAGRCREVVDEAAAALGGLDAVVYATGWSPIGRLASTGSDVWGDVLATNLVGAALVASAALPHLARGRQPMVALLSSHSVGRPWPGLVPYAASKAALDQLALGLRDEESWLRVIRVVVGPTATSFADGWDPAESGPLFERWDREGHLGHEVLQPDVVAARILDAMDDPAAGDEVNAIGRLGME